MSDEPEWGLVMPFVACKSQGGAFDDTSFVSGYRLGGLDATLALMQPLVYQLMVKPSDLRQCDLIAMKHGYTVGWGQEDEYEGEWINVTFRPVPPE